MKLNIVAVKKLIDEQTKGNYRQFAKLIGVDPAHLYRAIKQNQSGGAKIIGALIKYCKNCNLDFQKYIFLE